MSTNPAAVTTILGSCVSVCLWDEHLNVGGINHYLLPLWNGVGLASPKYGNIAIERLITKLLSLGSTRENLRAKIFGGAEILDTNSKVFNVGQKNVEVAFRLLQYEKISIVNASVGGNLGRKIIFYTQTGKVQHKFIEKTINQQVPRI